jgi:2-dehydro-3-deoxyphosphogluconate aldolase/(4S)-4-hydroxy-2-oxoglutarate aldolase
MKIERRSLLAASLVVPAAALAACTPGDSDRSTTHTNGLPNLLPDATADQFAAQQIVPVLRNSTAGGALATAQAWIAAGCTCIELTTSTPDVFTVAERLSAEGAFVGIGTMRSADDVNSAADAGARYVLSFATFPALIDTALDRGLTPIPGTMTPTEVFASLRAPIIKIFPAATVGIGYLKALQVVYPGVRTQVTGGIGATPVDARAWLDAGATAVGVPGDVCGTAETDGADAVAESVRRYLAALQA